MEQYIAVGYCNNHIARFFGTGETEAEANEQAELAKSEYYGNSGMAKHREPFKIVCKPADQWDDSTRHQTTYCKVN